MVARSTLLLLVLAAPLGAQTISRTPASQPRPVAIHREPQPVPPPERPKTPVIVVEGGYNPAYFANYGGWPLPYVTATYVQEAPPAAVSEVPGPAPGPATAFIAGHFLWNGGGFTWNPGRWVPIPAGYIRWVPGRWEHNQHGYYWLAGYWSL